MALWGSHLSFSLWDDLRLGDLVCFALTCFSRRLYQVLHFSSVIADAIYIAVSKELKLNC